MTLPIHNSLTHDHLFNIIRTELCKKASQGFPRILRILEVGCGNARLMAYIAASLAKLENRLGVEIYGLEVYDYGSHYREQKEEIVTRLNSLDPRILWSDRLVFVSTADTWPFEDNYFDIIYSNQVMEHVSNHNFLFREINRCLQNDSVSIHLFPLKHCIIESHLKIPYVQYFSKLESKKGFIRFMSRLGFGKYHKTKTVNLDAFCLKNAEYMQRCTNYLTSVEVFNLAERHNFNVSFLYTSAYYVLKLRRFLKLNVTRTYSEIHSEAWDNSFSRILRYLSSVTLVLRKKV